MNLPDDAGRQHVLFLHTSRRRRKSTRPAVWESRFTPSLSCKVAYATPSTTSPLNLSFDAVDVTGVRLEPLVCVWLAPRGCGFTSGVPCSSHLPRQRECCNGKCSSDSLPVFLIIPPLLSQTPQPLLLVMLLMSAHWLKQRNSRPTQGPGLSASQT